MDNFDWVIFRGVDVKFDDWVFSVFKVQNVRIKEEILGKVWNLILEEIKVWIW